MLKEVISKGGGVGIQFGALHAWIANPFDFFLLGYRGQVCRIFSNVSL